MENQQEPPRTGNRNQNASLMAELRILGSSMNKVFDSLYLYINSNRYTFLGICPTRRQDHRAGLQRPTRLIAPSYFLSTCSVGNKCGKGYVVRFHGIVIRN
jgi:hypothetical protein